jgi:hypothetical protein
MGPVERLPEPVSRRIDGIALPVLTLDLRVASAVDLVALAVARLSSPAALA